MQENKEDEEKEEVIILCRCFACKGNYIQSLMKAVSILEPFEESYQKVKRYICPECHERLKQFKFVKESEQDDKNKKGDKNEKGEKGETSTIEQDKEDS